MTRLTVPSTSPGQLGVPGQLTIADLPPASGLTDQFDDLLLRLCDTETHASSSTLSAETTDSRTRFCHHLRHALESDTVYLCDRNTLHIVATSSSAHTEQQCADTLALHQALTSVVSDLWHCADPIYLPEISVFPESNRFSFMVLPLLNDTCDQLLIAVDAEVDNTLIGHYFSAAVSGLFNIFISQNQPNRTVCESQILDLLQAEFRNSSTVVTDLRLNSFKQQLKSTPVLFDEVTPSSEISSSKALCTQLPEDLYTTAQLWQGDFIAALDSHCLTESSYGYKTLCENYNLLKFEASRPLQVKVHAQSLRHSSYIDTLTKLKEKSVIHDSRLCFDVLSATGDEACQVIQSAQLSEVVLTQWPPNNKSKNKPKPPLTPVRENFAEEFDVMGAHGIGHHNTVRLKKAANE